MLFAHLCQQLLGVQDVVHCLFARLGVTLALLDRSRLIELFQHLLQLGVANLSDYRLDPIPHKIGVFQDLLGGRSEVHLPLLARVKVATAVEGAADTGYRNLQQYVA